MAQISLTTLELGQVRSRMPKLAIEPLSRNLQRHPIQELTQLFSFLAKTIKGITGKTKGCTHQNPRRSTQIYQATPGTIHVTAGDKTSWADKYTKLGETSFLETNMTGKKRSIPLPALPQPIPIPRTAGR